MTKGKRLRERGHMPKLADSLVMTMELVGTFVGLSQDQEVFDYFRCHHAHFFSEMARVARTTFVRQAANLWAVKERLWYLIRDNLLLYDPMMAIVDRMPIPLCQFARAYGVTTSMTRLALAKIILAARRFTAFTCICA